MTVMIKIIMIIMISVSSSPGSVANAPLGSMVIPNGPTFAGISDDQIALTSTQFGYVLPDGSHDVTKHLRSIDASRSLH